MIRLIQRRLIIPRGDTGTFSIPMLPGKDAGDVSIFTIFDPLVHRKVFEKSMNLAEGVLNIEFTHNDTVNLPVGQYVWDIKFYSDPQFVDGKLVNGTEIDSYYAAFALPVCEIRETGDSLLTDDNAPQATLAPDQLDIITAAITEVQAAERQAVDSAAEANASAGDAETAAAAAQASERAALESQNAAEEAQREAAESATAAQESMEQAQQIAQQIHEEIPTKVSDLVDDSGHYIKPETGIPASDLEEAYLTSFTETDPTVPEWAKQPQKPTYTAQEVGALPADTVIPTVPTNVSAFTNDAGYLTEHQDINGKANAADLAAVATSGSYNDLEDKPFIPSAVSDLTDDSGHYTKPASGIPASDLANGVLDVWSGLTYHTSTMSTDSDSFVLGGATDAPTEINKCLVTSTPSANVIPKFDYQGRLHSVTPEEEWDGSNAVATTEYVDNMISDNMPEVPTNVSELTNDAGYITGYTETDPTVPAWAKAAQKPSYTAAEVGAPTVQEMNTAIGNAIGNINSFDMAVVQALPTENISTHTIYLVPKTGETNDVYDEHVYINSAWEMVGNTQIDLSNYATKSEIPEVPVQDVQVNGTSILSNGVANVPIASSSTLGVVKYDLARGTEVNSSGVVMVKAANDNAIKSGSGSYQPIVPTTQHRAAFYGLAKAAGDTTQSASANAVGTYTDEAKDKIQHMLGIDKYFAPYEADITSDQLYNIGDRFIMNGLLYEATNTIALGDTITPSINCENILLGEEFIRKSELIAAINQTYNGIKVADYTTTEDLTAVTINTDLNGLPFKMRNIQLIVNIPPTTTAAKSYFLAYYGTQKVNSTSVNMLNFTTLSTVTPAETAWTVFKYEAQCYGTYTSNLSAVRASSSTTLGTGSANSGSGTYFNYIAADYIVNVKLTQYNSTSSLIPAGTRFILYGVPVLE